MTTDRDWLTPEKVAELCDVHISTVRKWISAKTIQARKVGGRWRIPAEEAMRAANGLANNVSTKSESRDNTSAE